MSGEITAPPPAQIVCAACGTHFVCEPAGDCWCFQVDVRLPMPAPDATCLCPACLVRAAREAGR